MNKNEVISTLLDATNKYGLVNTLHETYGHNIKVSLGYSKSDCDSSIDELMLSVRSQNALRRAGIFTIGTLIEALSNEDLLKIRNLGAKSFREIKTKILAFGYERLSQNEKRNFFTYLVENN